MPYNNGVYVGVPGVNISVNDVGFQPAPNVGGLGVLFIGPATDGQPNTLLSASTPQEAKSKVKGGDLLQAILNAFAGASKMGGSITVKFIRPELATQATSTINSGSATAQIVLTDTSYGTLGNSDKWNVTAGSTSGYKVTQARDFVGPGGQIYQPIYQDNIALPVFSVYYTGADTNVRVTVTDSTLTINGTTTPTIATIALSSGVTVQQIVNQINQLTGFTAAVLDPNPQDSTWAFFDNVSAVAVATSSTTPTTLSANVTAVVRWFNQQNAYFTAVRQANASSLGTSTTYTYASGGTTPTAANSDWQNAYTTAQAVTGINLTSCVTSSTAIWGMNDAHCAYMNSLGSPRKGYLGDALSQTLTTEIVNAKALNSQFSTVIWPEQQGVDYNGNPTTFPPYLVAASVTGERAAIPPYNALTQQPVPSNGMGQTVTPGMVQQALAGGVAVIAPDSQGNIVLQQDRTTWLQSTAYDKVENSTGLVVAIVTVDLNATLQPFLGTPVGAGVVAAAVLSRLLYWYGQGYIQVQPKASDVSITKSVANISGSANAAFAVPTNNIELQLNATAA
jgi:hypothetical protein